MSAFAFYGRVSTRGRPGPLAVDSPPARRLPACPRAVGGEVVAHYWDIESGRKALSERGDGAGVKVPRDGGLRDLLGAATASRQFDAVIVESIDRLSRMTTRSVRSRRRRSLRLRSRRSCGRSPPPACRFAA